MTPSRTVVLASRTIIASIAALAGFGKAGGQRAQPQCPAVVSAPEESSFISANSRHSGGAQEPRGGRPRDGCAPRLDEITPDRTLPHKLYDQGVTSLAALFPDHQLLVARRRAQLGEVTYALLVYRETPVAARAQLVGMALRDARAWRVDADCPVDSIANVLVRTLEIIAGLPGTAPAGRRP